MIPTNHTAKRIKDMDEESAVSKALRLPEIISIILYHLSCDKRNFVNRALVACTLLNSSWEPEANRWLWQECSNRESTRYSCPSPEDLVAIRPERRQRYANHIRRFDVRYWHGVTHETSSWDGRWCPELGQLAFPRLEYLGLWCAPGIRKTDYLTSLPLIQFAQPKLRHISLLTGFGPNHLLMSEEFLDALAQSCPNLYDIQIAFVENDNSLKIPAEKVTSLVKACKSLKEFRWEWDDGISGETFRALSRCNQLSGLTFNEIQDSWLDGLQTSMDVCEPAFPKLMSLSCTISGDALEILMPSLLDMYELILTEAQSSARMWQVIANTQFEDLICLYLSLNSDTLLCGNELLSVLSNLTYLETLRISGHWHEDGFQTLKIKNFNNATVKRMAKLLPRLMNIALDCRSTSDTLNERSFTALGLNCPFLESCSLHANINWNKVVRAKPRRWSRLGSIDIRNNSNNTGNNHSRQEIKELARKLQQRMPMLLKTAQEPILMLGAGQALDNVLIRLVTGTYDSDDSDDSSSEA